MIRSRLLSGRINKILSYVGVFAFVLPATALASVQITEIMYDLPGGDAGREWVEVTNQGTASVDLSSYRLFEAGVNHKINGVSGGSSLAPGVSAVIADNAEKFKADWPAYAGLLFESAFSLSNTGEMLTLKNASSSIEDTVTYSSATGAAGDSGSLQRQGSIFVSALPTPGIFPGTLVPVKKEVTSAPAVKKTSTATVAKNSTSKNTSAAGAAAALSSQNSDVQGMSVTTLLPWLLGLAGIITLGLVGVVYSGLLMQPNPAPQGVTKGKEDEFEIIEE